MILGVIYLGRGLSYIQFAVIEGYSHTSTGGASQPYLLDL